MGEENGIGWPTCSEDECIGISLDQGGRCLAHARDQEVDVALKRLSDEGTIDARGVNISAELLDRILSAAPRHEQQPERPCFKKAKFDRATFGDEVRFNDAIFGEGTGFDRAIFGDGAAFDGATFGEGAWFGDATFGEGAWFGGAAFQERACFGGASFGDEAHFDSASFGNATRFGGASFGDEANFGGATFGDWVWFDGASFGEKAWFNHATFGNETRFDHVTFGDEARFDGATFGDWAHFGPLLADGRLVLDLAVFGRGPELTIAANRLDCHGMRLPHGAALNLRWAEVRLDGVDFAQPSVLAAARPLADVDETSLRRRVVRSWRTDRPRVLSLRGSDVRNLVLSNVDLRACRFSGAHNLDQLRLEATADFADRPAGMRLGWAFPPMWRWTRRRTLAEEHRWRRAQAKHAGWYPRACRQRVEQECSLQPGEVATLYRALRKGREDSKDEPGAADFYYGEMEMRRHDRMAPWPERIVLWLYWMFAGYALRATRALGWLLGLLAVATVLLAMVGFATTSSGTPLTATITGAPPQQRIQFEGGASPPLMTERPFADQMGTAAVVAVEGAVFRTSEQKLTYRGRLIHTTLRFFGPVLLGLTLLSIRGRVKR